MTDTYLYKLAETLLSCCGKSRSYQRTNWFLHRAKFSIRKTFQLQMVKQDGQNYLHSQSMYQLIKPLSIDRLKSTFFQCFWISFSTAPVTLPGTLSKAPSKRIQILFNPQLFFPDSRISLSTHRVFKSNSPVHTHSMISGFTVEKLDLHVVPPYWFIVQ